MSSVALLLYDTTSTACSGSTVKHSAGLCNCVVNCFTHCVNTVSRGMSRARVGVYAPYSLSILNKRKKVTQKHTSHMDEMHVKRVGAATELLDLPSADPAPALEELERRRKLVADPGPSVALPDSVLLAKRAAFETGNGGFWICNFANERLSTRCDRPNVRLLAYVRTRDEGVEKVAAFMRDVRVKSIPCLVPANKPFLIPFSEATAGDGTHTLEKIRRLSSRHIDFCKFRDDDFKRSVETKTPGETELSDYHRRKTYLARQETLRARDRDRDHTSTTTSATTSLFREASESSSSFGKPIFGAGGGGGGAGAGSGSGLTASEAFEKVCSTETRVNATVTATTTVTATATTTTTETLWQGELPAHWKPSATTDGPPVSAGDWPRDLESRHGRHGCISFIDDLDKAEDSPAYSAAAGMEPMMIIFGGEHEDVETAKSVALNDIGPWCTDLAIDVVDLYEWLWPTEVDPDKLTEEHRTANAGYTKEANMIEKQRKKTLQLTAEARAHAAAASIPLRETNANAGLPDVDVAVSSLRTGMYLQGEVVQLDAAGEVLVDSTLPLPSPHDDVPEI